MAYGQTSSGKTSTIRGNEDVGDGLIPMATRHALLPNMRKRPNIRAVVITRRRASHILEHIGKEEAYRSTYPQRAGDAFNTTSANHDDSARESVDTDTGGSEAGAEADEWAVFISYLEVYQEVVTDLITGRSGLSLYEHKRGEVACSSTTTGPRTRSCGEMTVVPAFLRVLR
eukprot:scaffold88735_cov28-Tisochrysis_lutea.AAC.2